MNDINEDALEALFESNNIAHNEDSRKCNRKYVIILP